MTSQCNTCHDPFLFSLPLHSESIYPEVRAAVSSVDDITMPANTFRTWLLGLFYTIALSGMNQVFSLRCQ